MAEAAALLVKDSQTDVSLSLPRSPRFCRSCSLSLVSLNLNALVCVCVCVCVCELLSRVQLFATPQTSPPGPSDPGTLTPEPRRRDAEQPARGTGSRLRTRAGGAPAGSTRPWKTQLYPQSPAGSQDLQGPLCPTSASN